MNIASKVGLWATLMLSAGLLCAQPANPPGGTGGTGAAGGGGGHHPPPPEALAACKSLSSGQACSFTSPHGAEQGSCWAPEGKPLACRPKNAPAAPPQALK